MSEDPASRGDPTQETGETVRVETELLYCHVCGRPLAGEARTLGGHVYCVEHHERVARENPAALRPIVIEVGAVVLFAALASIVGSLIGPTALEGWRLILVGIILAIVPAAIWLIAFDHLDQTEPVPKRLVIGVFVLGLLLAAAVGQPLIRDVFRVQDWLGTNPLTAILGSILVIGFIQEFLKYAVIRYTVFYEAEFDERIDGLIFGAAVGLGYATLLNLRFVLDHQGVNLGVGAITIAVVALAHASFSGVMGYFIGRARFEKMGPLWLPLGLIVAATLDGIVTYLLSQAPLLGTGFSYTPWYSLVMVTVITAIVFLVLFAAMRRHNAATLLVIRGR